MGLEIKHRGVMSLYVIKDKTAVVVVASYRSFSGNPVRFKVKVHIKKSYLGKAGHPVPVLYNG